MRLLKCILIPAILLVGASVSSARPWFGFPAFGYGAYYAPYYGYSMPYYGGAYASPYASYYGYYPYYSYAVPYSSYYYGAPSYAYSYWW